MTMLEPVFSCADRTAYFLAPLRSDNALLFAPFHSSALWDGEALKERQIREHVPFFAKEATAESHALARARTSACDTLRNRRALPERGGSALHEKETLRRRASKALVARRQRAPQDPAMKLSAQGIEGTERAATSHPRQAARW